MNILGAFGERLRSWTRERKRDENTLPSSNAGHPRVSSLFRNPPTNQGSSSTASLEPVVLPELKELNDHVYEIFNPPGRPSIEIVFFHGLQLEWSERVHINTWISRDGSQVWLKWIVDAYPKPRIVVISYDASINLAEDQGLTDMYITRENLFQDLTTGAASVGQDGCPVILVGHCMGGLVLKQVCVQANSIVSLGSYSHRAAQNLLNNIQGLFFYGSPHHGSQLANSRTRVSKGLLFQDTTTLNLVASRRNEEFRQLRRKFEWKAYGIGEMLPVTMQGFRGLVVAETSARYDVDSFYTVHDDHFNVCRPASTKSSSFLKLSNFVADVLKENEARADHTVDLAVEVVGLDKPVKLLMKRLEGEARLGIVGMGGRGKTTLAKALFNSIAGNFEYTCFMEDVKTKVASKEDPIELRRKITDNLYYRGEKVAEKFKWSDLERKRVLIVLDDVDSESQFFIMTERDHFANESRVIATSRDRQLLERNSFNCHFTQLLNDDDSRNLFCRHAFKMAHTPRGYEQDVEKFVKKCSGLPLALTVAGKYLYNREPGELWDDALNKLSKAWSLSGLNNEDDPLWSIVEVSYNSLGEPEQEMFLDIATCFYGEPLEYVKRAWRVCSWASSYSGWVNLVDKGLVSTSGGFSNLHMKGVDRIQMHELLRDWGRKKAGRSRFCHHLSNKPQKWSLNEANSEIKVLKIVCDARDSVENNYLRRRLEVLHGFGESQCFLLEVGGTSIGIEDLHELNEQLKALSHMVICYCEELQKLPESFGQLTALSHLEISECHTLQSLPEGFGQLQALSHLVITKCDALQNLPESFGQLKALSYLQLGKCEKLQKLPESFGQLSALTFAWMKGCKDLRPEFVQQLKFKYTTVYDCEC